MGRTAFVFPGQGSQRVGMGLDLVKKWPYLIDEYYAPADDILGIPLSALIWNGPAEDLSDMRITQPAMLLTSVAALDVLRAHGAHPDAVAGHSLGEFAALVCAGVLTWTDALRVVRTRGELMASVTDKEPGRMAAVVGLRLTAVEELCLQASSETGEIVEIANHNDFTQVVVSGRLAAVDRLLKLVVEAGAGRTVILRITGPAHCSLMGGVDAEYAAALESVEFRDPVLPIYSGSGGARVTTGAGAKGFLRAQLTGRVLWTDVVERMAADGVNRFVEVGPGKTLSGLCGRILPDAIVHRSGDTQQLEQTVDAVARAPRDPV
ncbi:ACP S-malonyltransferase [Streptomyces sp. RKAG290]|uniref:ACP S-malonyltransferase n=1 Tax=Streptomyces sp. RKAG290 TaxID=2888348 RepID=UPI002033AA4F|nr:ACP S-malonyltransferase [Streptomyces sp. RKAG290]MCM2414294.1 ACP S-malonyltransferase [Streptomyces sp. RKAG290]